MASTQLIGPTEAARRLGVSRGTIYGWLNDGKLEATISADGKNWGFTEEALAKVPKPQDTGRRVRQQFIKRLARAEMLEEIKSEE